MSDPLPDGMKPEILAAYVDGELPEHLRAWVEEWLLQHPDAQGMIDDQASFSRDNFEFWSQVEPPRPGGCRWGELFRNVSAKGLGNCTLKKLVAASIALAITTTLGAVFAFQYNRCPGLPEGAQFVCPHSRPHDSTVNDAPTPLSDFILAQAHEVEVISVREADFPKFLKAKHPLHDAIQLAQAEDVEYHSLGQPESKDAPAVSHTKAASILWAPAEAKISD